MSNHLKAIAQSVPYGSIEYQGDWRVLRRAVAWDSIASPAGWDDWGVLGFGMNGESTNLVGTVAGGVGHDVFKEADWAAYPEKWTHCRLLRSAFTTIQLQRCPWSAEDVLEAGALLSTGETLRVRTLTSQGRVVPSEGAPALAAGEYASHIVDNYWYVYTAEEETVENAGTLSVGLAAIVPVGGILVPRLICTSGIGVELAPSVTRWVDMTDAVKAMLSFKDRSYRRSFELVVFPSVTADILDPTAALTDAAMLALQNATMEWSGSLWEHEAWGVTYRAFEGQSITKSVEYAPIGLASPIYVRFKDSVGLAGYHEFWGWRPGA
jgi:hypothetical protein